MPNNEKKKRTIAIRKDENKKAVIGNLRIMPILKIVLDRAGISRATYYRWREEDAGFAKDADVALSEGVQLINDLSESQLISLIKEKNFSAIQMWLRNNHPGYATKVEVSGRIAHVREELSEEERELLEKALRLAMPQENNGTNTESSH